MELPEFVARVPGFDAMADREKIRHFAWYLHSQRKMQVFATGDVRRCFEELHLVSPNISLHLIRMSDAKPPSIIRSKDKFKLHRRDLTELENLYGAHPATIAVSKLLLELPVKVPDLAQRAFLEEAINCYRVRAFRAAIVMTWNLAYDHLVRWILADPVRLASFSGGFAARFPRRNLVISARQDFDDVKESEVIEACNTAGLVSSNVVRILREKLTRRNMAAHPSSVTVGEPQANDVITDLVSNVVLTLI